MSDKTPTTSVPTVRGAEPKVFRVSSNTGVWSPGLWKLFLCAKQTQPKKWCLDFLDAYLHERATPEDLLDIFDGKCTAEADEDGTVVITIKPKGK